MPQPPVRDRPFDRAPDREWPASRNSPPKSRDGGEGRRRARRGGYLSRRFVSVGI